MASMTLEKVLALPESLQPNTVYIIKSLTETKVTLQFTNSKGDAVFELKAVDDQAVKDIIAAVLVKLLGEANGIATLDGNKQLTSSQLPSVPWNKLTGVPDFPAVSPTGALSVDTTGNSATSTKLAGKISIESTGDVVWKITDFDGGSNVSAAATLREFADVAGSYFSESSVVPLTFDKNGRLVAVGVATPISIDWDKLKNVPKLVADLGASPGSTIQVTWSDITGKPTTLSGYGITVGWTDITDKPTTLSGYGITVGWSDIGSKPTTLTGYGITVGWSDIGSKPTTTAGYGITDAISTDMITDLPTSGKLLKVNSDNVLPSDISGKSATTEKLTTSRKLEFIGDATGSAQFDGSSDIQVALTVVGGTGGSGATANVVHPFLFMGK